MGEISNGGSFYTTQWIIDSNKHEQTHHRDERHTKGKRVVSSSIPLVKEEV